MQPLEQQLRNYAAFLDDVEPHDGPSVRSGAAPIAVMVDEEPPGGSRPRRYWLLATAAAAIAVLAIPLAVSRIRQPDRVVDASERSADAAASTTATPATASPATTSPATTSPPASSVDREPSEASGPGATGSNADDHPVPADLDLEGFTLVPDEDTAIVAVGRGIQGDLVGGMPQPVAHDALAATTASGALHISATRYASSAEADASAMGPPGTDVVVGDRTIVLATVGPVSAPGEPSLAGTLVTARTRIDEMTVATVDGLDLPEELAVDILSSIEMSDDGSIVLAPLPADYAMVAPAPAELNRLQMAAAFGNELFLHLDLPSGASVVASVWRGDADTLADTSTAPIVGTSGRGWSNVDLWGRPTLLWVRDGSVLLMDSTGGSVPIEDLVTAADGLTEVSEAEWRERTADATYDEAFGPR